MTSLQISLLVFSEACVCIIERTFSSLSDALEACKSIVQRIRQCAHDALPPCLSLSLSLPPTPSSLSLSLTLSLSLSPFPSHSSQPHHLIINCSDVLMEDRQVFLALGRTNLDGLLVAFYRFVELLLLIELVTLLFHHTCSLQRILACAQIKEDDRKSTSHKTTTLWPQFPGNFTD